jgi:hypothetical protein
MNDDLADLVAHLSQTTPLSRATAERLVGDVLAHHQETVEQYVARRHGELVAQGFKNEKIFTTLVEELPQRRFAAPQLNVRQIRRLIYG